MFMLALAREGDGGDRILASLQFHTLALNSYSVLSFSVGEGFQYQFSTKRCIIMCTWLLGQM